VAAPTAFRVFPNLYQDSVSLMQIAAKLRARDGIDEASCVMATPANLAQLRDADLTVDARAGPSDLLVVVRGSEPACADALDAADALLRAPPAPASAGAAYEAPLTSIAAAVERDPAIDLALISVPGAYAAAEARKAVALGLDVMLFSDNVTIEEERAIKLAAQARGRIVMGPDCGTAIVNGVPLGFANVVRRGDIGLVAASGTGLQEVTCRIHNAGAGVSQALGTGGRDLSEEIGGITMLAGLRALAEDARTRVIVLVSKPPAPAIARDIVDLAAGAGKPVVIHFLGESAPMDSPRVQFARSLRHAADCAIALAQGRSPPAFSDTLDPALRDAVTPPSSGRRNVRGLFTGGTFCYEAQLAFLARGLPCSSNAPVEGAAAIDGKVAGHAFIDYGDDEYTRGRPHPMIDPSLRNAAMRAHASDPQTSVILFDVVLGYGAHADPATDLAATIRAVRASGAAAIGHVCGTDGDPQGRAAQVATLKDAGAVVADSNFEAAVLAARYAR